MNMAETASNISAQAKADPISDFRINEKSVVPIWIQIRKRLVYLISSGKFERGERLPSVRELSVQLGVNYNTVNKVYQDLERDGYIYTQRGRGTYVSDLKNAHLSVVDGDVEALAVDFVQQALTAGMSAEDIHDLVSVQLILLGGVA